jgi:Ataxin-2 C-terminal region
MVAAQKESVQNSEVNKLSDLLSKLNPSAKEFIPSSYGINKPIGKLSADAPSFVLPREFGYQFMVNGWNQELVADGFMSFSKQNAKVIDPFQILSRFSSFFFFLKKKFDL